MIGRLMCLVSVTPKVSRYRNILLMMMHSQSRPSIYLGQKLIIHAVNNVRRVPLKFGGIISRDSMGHGE